MEQKSFVNVNNKARRKKIVFNLDPHKKKNYIKKINHNEMRNIHFTNSLSRTVR